MISVEKMTVQGTPGSARAAAGSGAATGFAATLRSVQNRGRELDDIFEKAAAAYQLPPELLRAIAFHESGFNPNAVSSAGAMGLMQLMPVAVRATGISDPYDPEQNVMAGAKILRDYLDKYDGDLKLALAAYGAGSGAVAKHGGVPPYQETQKFVEDILTMVHAGDLSGWDHTGAPVSGGFFQQDSAAIFLKTTHQVRELPISALLEGEVPIAGSGEFSAVMADVLAGEIAAAAEMQPQRESVARPGREDEIASAQEEAAQEIDPTVQAAAVQPARETATRPHFLPQTQEHEQGERLLPPRAVPVMEVRSETENADQPGRQEIAGAAETNAGQQQQSDQQQRAPEEGRLLPTRSKDGESALPAPVLPREDGRLLPPRENLQDNLAQEQSLKERMAGQITTGRPALGASKTNDAFSEQDYRDFVATLPREEGERLLPPRKKKEKETAAFYLG